MNLLPTIQKVSIEACNRTNSTNIFENNYF